MYRKTFFFFSVDWKEGRGKTKLNGRKKWNKVVQAAPGGALSSHLHNNSPQFFFFPSFLRNIGKEDTPPHPQFGYIITHWYRYTHTHSYKAGWYTLLFGLLCVNKRLPEFIKTDLSGKWIPFCVTLSTKIVQLIDDTYRNVQIKWQSGHVCLWQSTTELFTLKKIWTLGN